MYLVHHVDRCCTPECGPRQASARGSRGAREAMGEPLQLPHCPPATHAAVYLLVYLRCELAPNTLWSGWMESVGHNTGFKMLLKRGQREISKGVSLRVRIMILRRGAHLPYPKDYVYIESGFKSPKVHVYFYYCIIFIVYCRHMQRMILCEAVRLALRKHEQVSQRDSMIYKRHGSANTCTSPVSFPDPFLSPPPSSSTPPFHSSLLSSPFLTLPLSPEVAPELVGRNKMELYVFDIGREAASLHQPLARVIAGELMDVVYSYNVHQGFFWEGLLPPKKILYVTSPKYCGKSFTALLCTEQPDVRGSPPSCGILLNHNVIISQDKTLHTHHMHVCHYVLKSCRHG